LCPKIIFAKGKEASLKSCQSIIAALGNADYGAFKIEGDLLHVGKGRASCDGSTQEKRHKDSRPTVFVL
jgi:hypothetical protein